MGPQRKKEIDGVMVEEYYWNGKMIVYVDHTLTKESFEQVCKRLSEERSKE